LLGYIEYENVNTMYPLNSNDLPMECSKLGDMEEILVGDHNERENEIENQRKLFKSMSPGQSLSSTGVPTPTLVSSAAQVPSG
jgi:hypothetical protein